MPGTQAIWMGASLLVAGAIYFAIARGMTPQAPGAVGVGAMVVGAGYLLWGLYQRLSYVAGPPETRAAFAEREEAVLAIRCMLAASSSDGTVRDAEVRLIAEAAAAHFAEPPSEDEIRRICARFDGAAGLRRELAEARQVLTEAQKARVLRAAWAVAEADGAVGAKEAEAIVELHDALRPSTPLEAILGAETAPQPIGTAT